MNYPKVSIIILNWNGLENTIECLESLQKITYSNHEVIIVDNGSKGNDVKILKQKFGEYVHVIKNKRNLGFAEGNNVGIRYAMRKDSGYILLLNNDTIVDADFLTELIKVAESDPKIGIVGPKIYYYYEPDKIWFAGGEIHWWKGKTKHLHTREIDKGQANKIREVDYITGCTLLVKGSVLKKIGLLDASYFSYFEETDFCVRAKQKNYTILYVPTAKVWHKISATSHYQDAFYNYYFARNRIIFMKKHGRLLYRLTFYPYQVFVKSLGALLIFGLKRKNPRSAFAYIKGIVDGLRCN
ncbi:MAG: glycosyltransferase family 2 protein [Patescibacteria group bacterium]|nr:glycosyltransferase family 2 protein [Patescibacteria group bacterium]MDI6821530.1 glycosyltransferase family 2 protein [Actinomycetota bacterium]